jgi:hypothetical protein
LRRRGCENAERSEKDGNAADRNMRAGAEHTPQPRCHHALKPSILPHERKPRTIPAPGRLGKQE